MANSFQEKLLLSPKKIKKYRNELKLFVSKFENQYIFYTRAVWGVRALGAPNWRLRMELDITSATTQMIRRLFNASYIENDGSLIIYTVAYMKD